MRFYDAAVGKWFVVDPLAESYYSYTPYNYVGNNSISFKDSNGMNRDWFENEQTGEIMNIKGENKVLESEKSNNWVNIGKDDKFGADNIPKGEKGTITKMNAKESKEFMKDQGYKLSPKLSYEAIRYDFAVSSITPYGTVSVENQYGEQVVVSRTYVKEDIRKKSNITVFTTEQHFGNSYTNYTKTQYNYSGNSLSGKILKFIDLSVKSYNGDASSGNRDIKNCL